MDANVRPQSSYLNRGFWVIVTFSPILRAIFLARAGATMFRIHRTRLRVIMKQKKPAVDRYMASFCSNMFADKRRLIPENDDDAF